MKKIFNIENNGARKIISIMGVKIKIINKMAMYQKMINTMQMHSRVFLKYKNCNKGKDIVLLATGPSLKDFIPMNNVIYIGVNRAFQYDKVKLDYAFIFDNSYPTSEYLNKLNKYEGNNVKKFYGICSDFELLNCTISESDALEANAERFYLYPEKSKNIPTYDISSEAFFNASSVVFPAMQFALWTNPKRIFIVGCDTNLNGYYYNNSKNYLKTNNVYKGWLKIKDFAKVFYPNTEIISINPVGLKGVFKDIYQSE